VTTAAVRNRHARLVEVVAHPARGRAERGQRRLLRRVDRDLDVVVAHGARLPGSHQVQLVRRQRPGDADGHDERHAFRVTLIEVSQQTAIDLGVALRRPRECPRQRGFGSGADADHECVICHAAVVVRDGLAPVDVDLDESALHQLGIELACDRVEPVAFGAAPREGSATAIGR
jgi:hypothetical protein